MTELYVLICVIGALIGFGFLIPIFRDVIGLVRGKKRIELMQAFIFKLAVGDIWMIVFLIWFLANRYFTLGGIPDIVLIVLATVIVIRPWAFFGWFRRWRRDFLNGDEESEHA